MKSLLLFCLLVSTGYAQTNLITNGSFEEFDYCHNGYAPGGYDIFDSTNCIGWTTPTDASADLHCLPSFYFPGNPPAYHGTAAAAILIHVAEYQDYREYIQNELMQTLEKDSYYLP
jgi:hypothetical protein